jgi:Mrp family chromosome partitioning ATPase
MSRNFELMQLAGRGGEFFLPSPAQGTTELPREVPKEVPPISAAAPLPSTVARDAGGGADLDQLSGQESLRLVQRIFLLQSQEPARMVIFAGVDHGNGVSHLCARTAQTLATNVTGSVCLVDANFRSPALPELFGTSNHYGLTDSLLREGPIRSFTKPLRSPNLWLLSCGALAVDSANLLNSNRVKERFAELRKEFDYVLIDAPPLTRYSDAIALGKLTDGFVLVLEAHSTRRETAVAMAENLRAAHIPILGAVFNKRTFPIPESVYNRL